MVKDNNCIAERSLLLAVGCQVMLIYNVRTRGLVNGSIGTVVAFTDPRSGGSKIPIVKFETPNGMIVEEIHHETWKMTTPEGEELWSWKQIPLILAWAVTIHKAQGATLDYIVLDLGKVFEAGQAYVGLSRVKNANNLILKNFSSRSFKVDSAAASYYLTLAT